MWKIGQKNQTSNKQKSNSLIRALETTEQDHRIACITSQSESLVGLADFKQVENNLPYQMEAERKRALGIIYATRSNFR